MLAVARRVAAQWRCLRVAAGLRAWADAARVRAAAKAALRSRIQNRHIASAWRSWTAMVDERASMLAVVRHAARQWLCMRLAAGLRAWADAVAERAQAITVLRVSARAWQQRGASAACAPRGLRRSSHTTS